MTKEIMKIVKFSEVWFAVMWFNREMTDEEAIKQYDAGDEGLMEDGIVLGYIDVSKDGEVIFQAANAHEYALFDAQALRRIADFIDSLSSGMNTVDFQQLFMKM